jgi:regulator of replication initiation timing
MRFLGFNITRGPAPKQTQDAARLLELLEETLKDKETENKFHELEKDKLRQSLAVAREQQTSKKEKSKVRHAKTALVHLLQAQHIANQLEMSEPDEVRDGQYNQCILERVVKARQLGVEVIDKNITQAIITAEKIINA